MLMRIYIQYSSFKVPLLWTVGDDVGALYRLYCRYL